jgi:two-component system cell cycle response regulator DivK
MLQFILERCGIHVSRAHNGEQALRRALETKPDVIITDLAMPMMDGWELIARLKADPQTQTIPVVALTAHNLGDDQERARAAGADGFLVKPITPGAFMEELVRLIGRTPHVSRNGSR